MMDGDAQVKMMVVTSMAAAALGVVRATGSGPLAVAAIQEVWRIVQDEREEAWLSAQATQEEGNGSGCGANAAVVSVVGGGCAWTRLGLGGRLVCLLTRP